MERRPLGRTGLHVSRIGLGCGPFGIANHTNDWDPWSTAGRATAVATIHRALDRSINYIDTAPAYGNGHAETLVGEVMKTRRRECVLATKVDSHLDGQGATDSVHASLKRLQTEHIDVLQVHGRVAGQHHASEPQRIIRPDVLDALRALRAAGKIGFIGVTSEEPVALLPFLAEPDVAVFQTGYNFVYQSAALHFLRQAAEVNAGVVTMRTLTSGILTLLLRHIASEWLAAKDPMEVSLRFVLSDSRVHAGLIGMRWPHEVDENVRRVEDWHPSYDLAALPRLTVDLYKAEDASTSRRD